MIIPITVNTVFHISVFPRYIKLDQTSLDLHCNYLGVIDSTSFGWDWKAHNRIPGDNILEIVTIFKAVAHDINFLVKQNHAAGERNRRGEQGPNGVVVVVVVVVVFKHVWDGVRMGFENVA